MKRNFEAYSNQGYRADNDRSRSSRYDHDAFSQDAKTSDESGIQSERAYNIPSNALDNGSNGQNELYRPRTPFRSQNESQIDYETNVDVTSKFHLQQDGWDVNGLTPLILPSVPDFDVCYGMLYRVNVKLLGDMSLLETYLFNSDISQLRTHFLFDIARSDDGHLFVNLSNGVHLAEVNKKETEVLSSLLLAKTVCLQALVDKRVLQSTIQSATFKHATLAVNINVYGPDQTVIKAEIDIGAHLSEHKLWLQIPLWKTPGTLYKNPHYLELSNTLSDMQLNTEDSSLINDDLATSVTEIYSMLTRESFLGHDSGNTSLHTPLLPHQEMALYFMTQREVGPIPPEFQSWEPAPQGESKRYRHKVANKVRSTVLPEELGAGILADEMGMGKTFSTLALILTSLNRAREWSRDEQSRLDDELPPTITLTHGTLIVVPSPLLLRTWTQEVQKRIIAPLKVLVYHGEKRERLPQVLLQHDIVVTTYHTLVSDYNHNDTTIKDIAWYRIVLDEAHFVRRSSSVLFKRVDEIHAKFRWCLTGTPIQNHLEDVGTLFKFLRLYPFDRLGIFRQYISEPFRMGGIERQRSRKALATLLDFFSLRRTKELLDLDHFSEEMRPVAMSLQERKFYNEVSSDMKRSMENNANHVEADSKLGLFHVQLQLRLLCNHGTYQHRFHWHRDHTSEDMDHNDIQEDFETWMSSGHEIKCSICRDLLTSKEMEAVLNYRACKHVLCSNCRSEVDSSCPLCAATLSRDARSQTIAKQGMSQQNIDRAHYFRPDGKSSKMDQLIKDLKEVPLSDKSIIFSQWTTTLDLVELYLRKQGIQFKRVDGMHEFRYRQRVLDQFKSDQNLPVLIMTLGVGANGLDLTVANRVFMLEPQWNPSVELQAIGRTLRIGQEKPVTVIRYVTQGSVEGVIREAQKKKLGMAAMSGSFLEQHAMNVANRRE